MPGSEAGSAAALVARGQLLGLALSGRRGTAAIPSQRSPLVSRLCTIAARDTKSCRGALVIPPQSPRQTLRNMIVGLGVAGVHAAFMGFLWLQIDVAVPVMEANTLDSQIEREKARATAGIGMFGASAKGRWQQREEEQGKEEEVSMAQALARMERR